MIDQVTNKIEKIRNYNIKHQKKRTFGIIYDISEHVNLVQCMDIVGNLNHTLIISEFLIYDSNHEEMLPLVEHL